MSGLTPSGDVLTGGGRARQANLHPTDLAEYFTYPVVIISGTALSARVACTDGKMNVIIRLIFYCIYLMLALRGKGKCKEKC